MTTRGNPFEELERLFERLSRQFDAASRTWKRDEPFGLLPTAVESTAVDLAEHDDAFVVTIDLPGFEREEVEVRLAARTLEVEADHEEAVEEPDEAYLRRERRHESIHRSLRLPAEVDDEAVTARMKHGVLTVTLPKTEAEEARRIDIE